MKQTIPVVDLQDFYDPAKKGQFISTVGNALRDIGFFAVRNHQIPKEQIDEAYSTIERFFLLPDETKLKYEKSGIAGQRGFTSFGKESAKDNDAPDLKEFWHVGRNAIIPNIWPEEVEDFKPVLSNLYNQMEELSRTLLQACSLYLDNQELDVQYLPDTISGGNSILRAIHYPPIPSDKNPSSIRAAAHEDINLITLLCESTDEGLQLLQRNGEWLPIRALEGQIIVDAGDMLQELTGGLFKSTTHRVVNPDNDRSRRFSMPFFAHPRPEIVLSERYTAESYLEERLRELGL